MVTLLPRVLGAIATSLVAWIALTLETHLGITVSPDERNALIATLVAVGMTAYALVHRAVSRRLNPRDIAKKPEAIVVPMTVDYEPVFRVVHGVGQFVADDPSPNEELGR